MNNNNGAKWREHTHTRNHNAAIKNEKDNKGYLKMPSGYSARLRDNQKKTTTNYIW